MKNQNSVVSPLHNNKSIQLKQIQSNIDEQDLILGDIETGIDDLGEIAQKMYVESKTTDIYVEDLNKGVENANSNIKFITDLTKKAIEKSGGQHRFFLIICFVVLFLILLFILIFA